MTFRCYTDNDSRIKKTHNGEGEARNYWLRSPYASSTTYFSGVINYGIIYNNVASYSVGVAFGFCLRSNIAE